MDDDGMQNNKILEESTESEDYEFHYSFITLPWDDRSRKSKIGILALLISLIICIIACVINGLAMHYKGYNNAQKDVVFCNQVRFEDYRYIARIHSVSSKNIICVGAMVNMNSALAHKSCIKSGPMKLQLGSLSDPRCRKGFMIDAIQYFKNETVLSSNMVLLTTYDDTEYCTGVVPVGFSLNKKKRANIIGATLENTRTEGGALSRQSVALEICEANSTLPNNISESEDYICVKDAPRCPIRGGDILLQNNQLYGVAISASSDNFVKGLIYFVNVQSFHKELDVGRSKNKV